MVASSILFIRQAAFVCMTRFLTPRQKVSRILSQIRSSSLPFSEIARQNKVVAKTVSRIAYVHEARDPSESETIRREWIRKARTRKTPPLKVFSEEEKKRLIEQNQGAINSVIRLWWQNQRIRNHFGQQSDFRKDAESFILQQLDYYDPNARGANGKPRSVGNYILFGTKLFCNHLSGQLKKTDFSLHDGRQGLSETGKKRLAKAASGTIDRKPTARELYAIPVPTKPLLRALGMDIDRVAVIGYAAIRDQIQKIAQQSASGLNVAEQQIIEMRLAGLELKQIAKKVVVPTRDGVRKASHTTIHTWERKAMQKIKERLIRVRKRQTG